MTLGLSHRVQPLVRHRDRDPHRDGGVCRSRVVTYFAILWSISSSLALILIGYAMLGTYFSVVIGRRLVGLNYYQERYQADFRFGLVHVRDNVEPIFLYGGERHERDQLRRRFSKVVANYKQLILWQRNLGFFTSSYGGVVALVPYWFLAGTYIAGHLQFGQVVQAATAFMSLHGALSVVVTSFPSLAVEPQPEWRKFRFGYSYGNPSDDREPGICVSL